MDGQIYWIQAGRKLQFSAADLVSPEVEHVRLHQEGSVRVTTGAHGTEVKWSVFSPSFASLYYVIETLPTACLPVVLRFYLSGWFEEIFQTADAAIDRIEQVIGKSELHITKRAFVEQQDPSNQNLPPLLQKMWNDQSAMDEASIDFVFDEDSQQYMIERIGSQSTIAKFYGLSPRSYPYVNGGSYDDIVYEAYSDVLKTGKRRYDHVLAAMRMPDNIVRWVPYQRIVIPKPGSKSHNRVSVVTEIAEVGIKPL
jgi:hypothetical protein